MHLFVAVAVVVAIDVVEGGGGAVVVVVVVGMKTVHSGQLLLFVL